MQVFFFWFFPLSNEATVVSLLPVPTRAPTNVKVVSSTPSSIKVSWGPIPEDYRKGVILGYVVFYREQGSMPWSERDVSVVYWQELTGLTSGKSYLVRVAGYTKMGRGAKSGPKSIVVGGKIFPHGDTLVINYFQIGPKLWMKQEKPNP